MKFQIPFNPDFFRRESLLVWDLTVKKNLNNYTRGLVFGLSAIVVSIPLLFVQTVTGYAFLFFGLGYSYFSIYFLRFVKKSKKKFVEAIEEEIKGHLKYMKGCTWEFEEDYFHFVDYKMDQKIQWLAFSEFEVMGNVLLLKFKNATSPGYLLDGNEIGASNFAKIIDLLSTKIQSQPSQLV